VTVVPYSPESCLSATVSWSIADTGRRQADCSRSYYGAECESTAIFKKTLHVAIHDPSRNRVIVESTSALLSEHSSFTDQTYVALCSAAFRNYPQPLQSEPFEVDTK
jgi:hypothetical protein